MNGSPRGHVLFMAILEGQEMSQAVLLQVTKLE